MTTIASDATSPSRSRSKLAVVGSRLVTPSATIVVLCVLQLAFWTIVPAVSRSALPRNVIEGYGWAQEWILLSYKHPQLPAWCLGFSRALYGGIGWPAYLLSQIFVCATYVLVFLLGRDLAGVRFAAAGTLMLAGCYFFTWPTIQFDHNVAQMPFWAGIAWCLWRAVERDKLHWWLALAAAGALGMYAKLSTGVLLVMCLSWLLVDGKARIRFANAGPWLSLALFLVLTCPLFLELWKMQFQPLKYMSAESAGLGHNPFFFILKETGDNAAFYGLVGVVVLAFRRAGGAGEDFALERRKWAFLCLLGLAPLGGVAIASLKGGINAGWAAPMYNLTGLIVVGLMGRQLTPRGFASLAASAFGVVVVFAFVPPVIETWQRTYAYPRSTALWPEAAIAARFETLWRSKTNAPLAVVGGDAWIAGLIADPLPQARMFTELNPSEAPWITPEIIRDKGLLVVWREGFEPAGVLAFEKTRPAGISGQEAFVWSSAAQAKPLHIEYLMLPPGSHAGALYGQPG